MTGSRLVRLMFTWKNPDAYRLAWKRRNCIANVFDIDIDGVMSMELLHEYDC